MNNTKGAIITGSAKRLGRGIAMFLAKCGYSIIAHYNSSIEEALSLKNIIEKIYHQKCLLIKADLTIHTNLSYLIKESFKFNPNCKILINNASIFYPKTLLDTTFEDYLTNYQLHLHTPLFLTKYFTQICQSNGSIINIIDANISVKKSKYFPYMLSKKSLANFTTLAASELFPKITINAICPTLILNSDLDNISYNNLMNNLKVKNILEKIEELIDNPKLTGKFYFI